MQFVLDSISVDNFRNYENFQLENLKKINILVGPNAVGKTNLIEAIQLCTELSSFRHATTSELINNSQENKNKAIVCCNFAENLQDELSKSGSNISMSLEISDHKKQYKINGKNKPIKDIKGTIPAVIFNPDDLFLIKGSNSLRRNMIDSLGGQISNHYYTVRKDYSKTLRNKNKLLKETEDVQLIKSINQVLVVTGAQLTMFRVNVLQKMIPYVKKFYKEISQAQEDIDIEYISNGAYIKQIPQEQARANIAAQLEENFNLEILKKQSIVGPHTDEIKIILNKQDASRYASQGQQRSIVLAFKLAQVHIIKEQLDKYPIVLLDDVMSELDSSRRNKLMNFVDGKTQVFITTTNLDYFENDFIEKSNILNCNR